MAVIPYKARNFGKHMGSNLVGLHQLPVSWEEIVWSAITVGKRSSVHLFTHGTHSLSDIIVRTHTVYANLYETGNNFEKSSLYETLDPTEKGATSYFLGMLSTKLLAAKLLNTPWVFHVSSFQAAGGVVTFSHNMQPDMIGLNQRRDWIVLEAKGRSNRFDTNAMKKAKMQTQCIRAINGQPPALRVGVQAYFKPEMAIVIDDPEEVEDKLFEIKADLRKLFDSYYSFLKRSTLYSNDIREIDGAVYRFYCLEDIGLTLGLNNRICEATDENNLSDILTKICAEETTSFISKDGVTIFPDGIAVELDERWSHEAMAMQPLERSNS